MSVSNKLNSLISNKTNTFEWLLALILITLPLKHNINSIFIIILFVYSVAVWLISRQPFSMQVQSIHLFVASLYFLSLISISWTIDYEKSMEGMVQKLPYLILPLIFAILPKEIRISSMRINRKFSFAMVLYATYCLIIASIMAIKKNDVSYLFYHKLSNNLNNLNAIYMSVFVAFALLYYLINKRKNRKYIYIFLLGVFLILLSSKTVIIGVIFLVFFSIIGNYKRIGKNYLGISLMIVLILSIVFSKNLVNRFNLEVRETKFSEVLNKKEFGEVYYWTGSGLRLFQARMFIELMNAERSYFTGFGIDASQEKLTEKYKEYNLYPGFYNYDFHNQYLQTFADLGVLGLILLLAIFFKAFIVAMKKGPPLLFSLVFLTAIVCLTESFLWRQWGMVFFLTLLLTHLRKNPKNQIGIN